jgi:hypothetical protein
LFLVRFPALFAQPIKRVSFSSLSAVGCYGPGRSIDSERILRAASVITNDACCPFILMAKLDPLLPIKDFSHACRKINVSKGLGDQFDTSI